MIVNLIFKYFGFKKKFLKLKKETKKSFSKSYKKNCENVKDWQNYESNWITMI